MRDLTLDDIEALATGAWVLGTGGGGSPYLALLNMRRLYAEGKRVALLAPEELADDDQVAVVSNMGAPLVSQERLADSASIARAVQLMEEYLGITFRAIMSVEIGGNNGVKPLLAAAELGRPVVDADAMGRAYPEAQMTSFAVGDLRPWPLAMVDPRGIEGIVAKVPSWKWMERMARKMCVELGSTVANCKAPRSGAEVKRWGILHTTSKAIELGYAIQAAQREHRDPIAAVLKSQEGLKLFTGKVADIERRTTEGFLRGVAKLDGLDADRGHRFELAFQNEWAVGWQNGVARVMTPDLICVLDTTSGEAIGTETIRYGQRVTVIALPAPPVFLSPRGLDFVGPRAFGYDLDFTSVFPS
ncbi:DUF917 domain-containing protein [Roseomonas sp. E05]|uniref:DUF917 domain-containing protein n=1 Tax=Roseomonas sp. E05 TaxID=3046310 RepID=UPI0024BA555C|nr:DUF917 domain-containing protein [Roseomonas sp. E05]MDJ0388817.1 DUF917 domain-containing protein [Roseomonas sp. E05]